MPEKKPVYGIWIVPDIRFEIKNKQELKYNTIVGIYKKNKKGMFVTTPLLQNIIVQNGFLLNKQIGEIELKVFENARTLQIDWFYPLGFHTNEIGRADYWVARKIKRFPKQ